MTNPNKAELRRLAEAAMAGDWFKAGDLLCFDMKTGESHGLNADDDRFIAAANPAAALSLLNECESLHSALGSPDEITAEPAGDYDALRKQFISLLMLANSKAKQAQYWRSQSDHAMHQTLVQTAANVNAERDTNAMLTDALMKAEAERDAALAERDEWERLFKSAGNVTRNAVADRDQLRAQVEALRKDAERYRWLRKLVYASNPRGEGSWSFHYEGFPKPISNPCSGETRANWDACIDAAMSQEAPNA